MNNTSLKNRIENRIEDLINNSEILDKRAYFTVSDEGEIKRKRMNLTIPAMVFCSDDKVFKQILTSELDPVNRIKRKQLCRKQSIDIDTLKKKTLIGKKIMAIKNTVITLAYNL